ncbi:MAG: SGNH/GDSL hydrolase family protein [Opitutus sp.]|nr:SGNH/GDSL hydrolase family protein [Opitutus sp.]
MTTRIHGDPLRIVAASVSEWRVFRSLTLAATILAAGHPLAASAADLAAEARAERPGLLKSYPEAFAPVAEDPKLPRVLLIGDSISIGYTPAVRGLLGGVANVQRIPDNGGPTTRGLALIDEWLGDGRWDVIHFNFGLHDIARVNAGQPRVTAADHGKNLRALVARLKATGARVIFATTTPVPNAEVRPVRRDADVIAYNAIATGVMAADGVAVNDLYAMARPRLDAIQQPANVHFTSEGYRALAEPVAAAIRAQLATKGKK